MADFLVKSVDATHKDPAEALRGCYKRGDVVQVYGYGECKESPAPNSKMYIVRVPNMTKREAEKYTVSEWDGEILVQRRLYQLDFAELSQDKLGDLEKGRVTSVVASRVVNIVKVKTETKAVKM